MFHEAMTRYKIPHHVPIGSYLAYFFSKTWQGELKLTGPIVIEVTKILEMFFIVLATKASH